MTALDSFTYESAEKTRAAREQFLADTGFAANNPCASSPFQSIHECPLQLRHFRLAPDKFRRL